MKVDVNIRATHRSNDKPTCFGEMWGLSSDILPRRTLSNSLIEDKNYKMMAIPLNIMDVMRGADRALQSSGYEQAAAKF